MIQRDWPVPASEPAQARAAPAADAADPLYPGGVVEIIVRFAYSMMFFGLLGFVFWSWFPLALGLFLFVTNDELIEWVLCKLGIRFVADTLGPEFIKASVFFAGACILLAPWKDAAPKWLLGWIPPDTSFLFIGAAALFCATLKLAAVAIVKQLLPRIGIEITRQRWAILAVLGLLIGLAMLAGLAATS